MDRTSAFWSRLLLLPTLSGMWLIAGCQDQTSPPQIECPVESGATPRLLPETAFADGHPAAIVVPAAHEHLIACLPAVKTPEGSSVKFRAEKAADGAKPTAKETLAAKETPAAEAAVSAEPKAASESSEPAAAEVAADVGPITSEEVEKVGSERIKMPWTSEAIRGPEMDVISRRADDCIRRGMNLAERGAVYSARTEFVQGLKVIAQALDTYHGTAVHGNSLIAGLRAIDEAGDFIAQGLRLDSDLNVAAIVASHSTPILKEDSSGVTPLAAMQRYYTFAQEQLAVSVGKQPVGSKGLFALGKLQTLPCKGAARHPSMVPSEAVVFYQAALAVDEQNAQAANELGVVLARHGRLDDAKAALRHSVAITSHPVTWRNLAVVHRQLGEHDFAKKADQMAAAAAERSNVNVGLPGVQWVAPEAFARSSTAVNQPAVAAGMASGAQPAVPPSAAKERKNLADWLPWNKSRK